MLTRETFSSLVLRLPAEARREDAFNSLQKLPVWIIKLITNTENWPIAAFAGVPMEGEAPLERVQVSKGIIGRDGGAAPVSLFLVINNVKRSNNIDNEVIEFSKRNVMKTSPEE